MSWACLCLSALQAASGTLPGAAETREGQRLALVLDTSASMDGLEGVLRAVGLTLLEPFDESLDVGGIVTFGAKVDRTEFTSDLNELRSTAASVRTGRSTSSLYNAIFIALKGVADIEGDTRKRAIVVVTDGEDTSSLLTREQIENAATQSATQVFTIVLPSRRRRDRSDVQFLEELGRTTGGETFAPRNLDEIKTAAEAIAERLYSKSGSNDEEGDGAASALPGSMGVDSGEPLTRLRLRPTRHVS